MWFKEHGLVKIHHKLVSYIANVFAYTTEMKGRKFKLSVHQKNEERRKMAKRKSPDTKNACTTSQVVTSPVEPPELSLNISIPLDVFVNGHRSSLDSLSNRLLSRMTSARPSHMDSWKIALQTTHTRE